MPELVEDTILVIESFKHDGVQYYVGDHVPTRHRSIRRLAAAHPEWFAQEYASEPLDLEWLASIEAEAEGRYEDAKRAKEAQKGQRERALREEMREQNQGQPELERRYRKQVEAQERAKALAQEERERESLENQVPLGSGFHF